MLVASIYKKRMKFRLTHIASIIFSRNFHTRRCLDWQYNFWSHWLYYALSILHDIEFFRRYLVCVELTPPYILSNMSGHDMWIIMTRYQFTICIPPADLNCTDPLISHREAAGDRTPIRLPTAFLLTLPIASHHFVQLYYSIILFNHLCSLLSYSLIFLILWSHLQSRVSTDTRQSQREGMLSIFTCDGKLHRH